MEVPQTEYVYETDRMVFFRVKYLTREHMVSICEIMKEWSPNTSYERNRIVYNKQLNQLYDLEIHDKIACVYTYDTSIILQEEYIHDILDFLTISIKKYCKTPMEANRCGFSLRVYKKNDNGYHTRSILGKQFPCKMEEIIYPFQFDSEFNRLKLRNVSDIHTTSNSVIFGNNNPTNDNSTSGVIFGNNNSTTNNNSTSDVMFGNNNSTNTGTNNSSSSGVIFGNNNSSSGVMFGNNNSTNNNSSGVMFGNNNSTNNNSSGVMFGNNNSTSGVMFGNNNSTSGVMFGNNNSTNTGTNNSNSSGIMFGNNSTSIFGPKSNNSGLFGTGQYPGMNNSTFGFGSQSNMFNYKK